LPAAPVVGFDATGIQLADGGTVTWDQVGRACFADADQPQLDHFLESIGAPLRKLRYRLAIGNVRGAEQAADALIVGYPDPREFTACLVDLVRMQARFERNELPRAAMPWECVLAYGSIAAKMVACKNKTNRPILHGRLFAVWR
jgi:hypothetical protein